MEVVKSFEFEGKKYEIKKSFDEVNIKLRAFHNDEPVNHLTYSTDIFQSMSAPFDIEEELIASAVYDVETKVFERYLEAIKSKKKCNKNI